MAKPSVNRGKITSINSTHPTPKPAQQIRVQRNARQAEPLSQSDLVLGLKPAGIDPSSEVTNTNNPSTSVADIVRSSASRSVSPVIQLPLVVRTGDQLNPRAASRFSFVELTRLINVCSDNNSDAPHPLSKFLLCERNSTLVGKPEWASIGATECRHWGLYLVTGVHLRCQ